MWHIKGKLAESSLIYTGCYATATAGIRRYLGARGTVVVRDTGESHWCSLMRQQLAHVTLWTVSSIGGRPISAEWMQQDVIYYGAQPS